MALIGICEMRRYMHVGLEPTTFSNLRLETHYSKHYTTMPQHFLVKSTLTSVIGSASLLFDAGFTDCLLVGLFTCAEA